MLAIEWVVLVGGVAALLGGGIGYAASARGGGKKRVSELETALGEKEAELSSYRADVLSQFAETAEKFKNLDASYHALHRQLATSAVALCGDQATPLLTQDLGNAGADRALDEQDVVELEVTEMADEADAQSVDQTDAAEPAEAADQTDTPDDIATEQSSVKETDEDVGAAALAEADEDLDQVAQAAAERAGDEEIVVAEELGDVPVLTEHVETDDDVDGEGRTTRERASQSQ